MSKKTTQTPGTAAKIESADAGLIKSTEAVEAEREEAAAQAKFDEAVEARANEIVQENALAAKPAVSHTPRSTDAVLKPVKSVDARKLNRAVLTDEGYLCPQPDVATMDEQERRLARR